jgi:purine nucleosidase
MGKQVIHDSDGHVDDLLSSMLLWLSPEIDLQAVTLTNGDCFVDQAFQAMLKMATYLDLEGAEIAYSEEAVINQFPENWRRESQIINELAIFSKNELKKTYQQGKGRHSDLVIKDCLTHCTKPLTVVATGPLTNLAGALQAQPSLKKKIREFIIMGGAFNVTGNVEVDGVEGNIEWNVYADPISAKSVLDSGVPIKLIPLDLTNELPVTKEFLKRLEAQSDVSKASMLAFKLWSLVEGFEYYFWDTLTAACAVKDDIFRFKSMRMDVVTQGKSQGKTVSTFLGGKKVQVAESVNKELFEDWILNTLRAS